MLDRAEAAQVLEIIYIDVPVVNLIAALAQHIPHHVLARTFGATGGGNRDKIPCGGELRVEAGVDGVKDFAFDIVGTHCGAAPVGRRIKPYLDGLADVFDRYENRGRVHTMDPSLRANGSARSAAR
jgi:hypothetical protein